MCPHFLVYSTQILIHIADLDSLTQTQSVKPDSQLLTYDPDLGSDYLTLI